jgi:hypothetical protein
MEKLRVAQRQTSSTLFSLRLKIKVHHRREDDTV